ncbi:MAG TPA: DUF4389 domain-containing protein [Solirubrobacteraceae bacterium]|nr:DUF4389 domain-containing protein [Solirubrobacteraceae bacterium]
MNGRPVQLIVSDDLQRSRLTVFFRLLLAIPHLIWLGLWGIAASVAVVVNWFATLIAGRSPDALHDFLAAYIRYAIHVGAYVLLAAEPFPDFLGKPGYPVDVTIAASQPQNRWKVGFRIVLAIPALIVGSALVSGSARSYGFNYSYGLATVAAFLGWFVALAQARLPRGLRDLVAYGLSYSAQLDAYLFLLTDVYPDSNPLTALSDLPARAEDPIELECGAGLERSRLTVFFRLLLAIPHLIWLTLWGLLAYLAAIVNWFATLAGGVSPLALHRFLAAYVRYQNHVYAYLFLIADPFPGFTGLAGSYPVDVHIEDPRPQNRWKVFFRLFLGLPAFLIVSAYGGLLWAVAFLGWFACLANGRMPVGMRNAGALALRYAAQTNGYVLLLTDTYPYSGPVAQASDSPVPAEVAQPLPEPSL